MNAAFCRSPLRESGRWVKRFSSYTLEADRALLKRLSNNKHSSSGLPVVHHEGYTCPHPTEHRFVMRKFDALFRVLLRDVIATEQVLRPQPVDLEECEGAHTREYLRRFAAGLLSIQEERRCGLPWSPGLVSRCLHEVGGTILAARTALNKGLACSTGGGTHHAGPNCGSGFCLLNDLAITAITLLANHNVSKVLIVDLDVHQGDGTAEILANHENTFTFSMHAKSNFPLRKKQSDLDVALKDGTADADYLKILAEYLPSLLSSFRPDIVLFDAGVDVHARDELGRLELSTDGLFQRDYYVISSTLQAGIPCATVIGGGYCRDLDELALRHSIVHRASTKAWNDRIACGF